jgi:hypothetical protein
MATTTTTQAGETTQVGETTQAGETIQAGEKGGTGKGSNDAKHIEYFDEKRENASVTDSEAREDVKPKKDRLKTARDLVTEVLLVEDDPSVNPWTFRMWFIGIGISVFGG